MFLLKVSRCELEGLTGVALCGLDDLVRAAKQIVSAGGAGQVAVTLGDAGALLVSESGAEVMPAADVAARSAVGAGDNFLAAMTYAFACGSDPAAALRLGVAAGAAPTLSPGTDLCHPWDVNRLASALHPPSEG